MGKQTKGRRTKKVPAGNKSRPGGQASVGSKKRLLVVMIAIFVLFSGVAAKMGYIVFAQGEALQEKSAAAADQRRAGCAAAWIDR